MLSPPDTSWDFGSFVLYEPVTVLTDLLVTAVCWYAAHQLYKPGKDVLRNLFVWYFLMMGMATAWGGILGHGFVVQLGFQWKMPGWFISMFAVALLERAAIFHAKPYLPKRWGSRLAVLNLVELTLLCIIVLLSQNFFFVEAHAFYGLMIIVAGLEYYIYRNSKSRAALHMLFAVGIAALAALVHLAEFSLHTWFNYLDLSHILMAVASYRFFIGAQKVLLEA
ncbi:MAG: DUF6962 family protein [Bacteroidia bacterium]